jgi:ABC-type multidrug transport system fused ATPase/permease subunit
VTRVAPQDALNKAMKGRTVIEIAHRVSTVRRAQNVAVMQVRDAGERALASAAPLVQRLRCVT